ncbi:Uncharacterized protein Rs2_40739 [Raphanus sativus]|nr:Uncharacterized protein Rs2_40739 [Raphanus sativus]
MTPSGLGLRRENIRDTTITVKIIAWRKKALVTEFPEDNTFGLTIRRTGPELRENENAGPSRAFLAEIMDTQEELPKSLSDREVEEDVRIHDAKINILEGEKVVEGKDWVTGEAIKRHGIRRKPLKSLRGAGSFNKMKMAQLVTSKRPGAKSGARRGDHSKQVEDKGTSNPQHDSAKH